MCVFTAQALKEASNANLLSRAWWFPFFRYLEGNVSANGALPRQYEWPLPWPKRLRSGVLPGKRSLIKGVWRNKELRTRCLCCCRYVTIGWKTVKRAVTCTFAGGPCPPRGCLEGTCCCEPRLTTSFAWSRGADWPRLLVSGHFHHLQPGSQTARQTDASSKL